MEFAFKIVFLGDPNVGKQYILQNYAFPIPSLGKHFTNLYPSPINGYEYTFANRIHHMKDNRIQVQVWDINANPPSVPFVATCASGDYYVPLSAVDDSSNHAAPMNYSTKHSAPMNYSTNHSATTNDMDYSSNHSATTNDMNYSSNNRAPVNDMDYSSNNRASTNDMDYSTNHSATTNDMDYSTNHSASTNDMDYSTNHSATTNDMGNMQNSRKWNGPGEEYYRNAVAAVVVYDVKNRKSFERVRYWIENVRKYGHEKVALILLANRGRRDCKGVEAVSSRLGAALAEEYDMDFFSIYCDDRVQIEKVFDRIIIPIGTLLMPQNVMPVNVPSGWKRVPSRSRPGEYSYKNRYTQERVGYVPTEEAKPAQYYFQLGQQSKAGAFQSTIVKNRMNVPSIKFASPSKQKSRNSFEICCSNCTIL